jgi:hypothetical protein
LDLVVQPIVTTRGLSTCGGKRSGRGGYTAIAWLYPVMQFLQNRCVNNRVCSADGGAVIGVRSEG